MSFPPYRIAFPELNGVVQAPREPGTYVLRGRWSEPATPSSGWTFFVDEVAPVGASPPRRQDSLIDQLRDVAVVAVTLGCYDAADWLTRVVDTRDPT